MDGEEEGRDEEGRGVAEGRSESRGALAVASFPSILLTNVGSIIPSASSSG